MWMLIVNRESTSDPDPLLPRSRHQAMKALLRKFDEIPAPPHWWQLAGRFFLGLFQP